MLIHSVVLSCLHVTAWLLLCPRPASLLTRHTHPWLEAELCDPELPVLTRSMLPPLWPESLLLVLDSLFLLSLSLASCNDGDKTGE